VQVPYAEMVAALTHMGLSPDVANGYTELSRAINEEHGIAVGRRTPANTTRTSFESWVTDVLVPAYKAEERERRPSGEAQPQT